MNDFSTVFQSTDFDLDGVHLVAASAGTGKTYNVQNIYARLIMKRGFGVREILVVTFTNPAARELKERLHAILVELYSVLSGENAPDKVSAQARGLLSFLDDEEKHQAARRHVAVALMEFDQAAISTIHGFCKSALSKYAFESGLRFNLTFEGENDAELENRFLDWWRLHSHEARASVSDPENLSYSEMWKILQTLKSRPGYHLPEDIGQDDAYGLMLHTAAMLHKEHNKSWASRENISFNDLIFGMNDALQKDRQVQGSPLVTKLREEYKAALIDEFQDTDPLQYAIFRRIFLEDGVKPPVFFVGDPKQAIYSFRGGDIFAYESAVREIPQERVFDLTCNFRSTPRLIDAVNILFKDTETERTFGSDAIPYDGTLRASADRKPLRLLLPSGEYADETSPFHLCRPHAQPNRGKLAWNCTDRFLVGEIIRLLNGEATAGTECGVTQVFDKKANEYRPLRPGDIAILLRSTEGRAAPIRELLRQQGVKSVLLKSASVFNSPMAKSLLILLQGLCMPEYRQQVKSVLLTPLVGLSAVDVAELSEDELSKHVQCFKEGNAVLKSSGFSAAVATMERLYDVRKRLAALPNGERLLSDFLQLVSLCQNHVNEEDISPEELVSWLDLQIKNLDKAEEFQQLLETEEDAVKIITMHSSKGLQFPVVFLPDCWKKTVNNQKNVLNFYHDTQNRLCMTWDKKDERVVREDFQEVRRLLYVAMTRAECRTVLIWPHGDGVEKILCEELNGLVRKVKAACKFSADSEPGVNQMPVDAPFVYVEGPAGAEDEELPVYSSATTLHFKEFTPPPELHSTGRRGSYSSLTENLYEAKVPAFEEREADEPSNEAGKQHVPIPENHPIFSLFPSGNRVGDCWHAILEKADFTAPFGDAALEELVRTTLTQFGFMTAEEPEVNRGRVEGTLDMLHRVFDYPLLDAATGDTFSLKEIGWQGRASEWQFNFSSRHAVFSTAQIATILERHWSDLPEKKPFLEQLEKWDRLVPHGYFTGFLDLLVCHHGRFYLLDWKSNSMGGKREGFTADAILHEMASSFYFVQYLLYSAVLHSYLKERLGKAYEYERHFGGIFYCFLRGIAADGEAPVFSDRPSLPLLEELAKAFGLETRCVK